MENLEKPVIKTNTFPHVLTVFLTILGVFVLAMCLEATHGKKILSGDYKIELLDKARLKIYAMKDSAMVHVNEPKLYNKYADSANHYITAYSFINAN